MAAGRARRTGIAVCLVVYVLAAGAALAAARLMHGAHPLAVAGTADVAATAVVFAASLACDNSSLYDPYWSVAPLPLALYWAAGHQAPPLRRVLVLLLVGAWAVRLTWNWLRGWSGLAHEDWRYVDLRAQSGRAYWLVSLLGIHLFPTAIVLAGCLPVWVAVGAGSRPPGPLDVLAAAVTAGAILIEAVADEQLRRFRATAGAGGRTLRTGLWARSRHPNYFGETAFWWGLFLFALAADPGRWWVVVGPLAITLMFLFVSIPMIDRRMLARRSDYAAVMAAVPSLVPRLQVR
jgi:steroid 5-alpha reductase family enzyme